MKFTDMPYARPDPKSVQKRCEILLSEFRSAGSAAAQAEVIKTINTLRDDLNTMASLARIRHTIDTRDPGYDAENAFFDRYAPVFEELHDRYYQALVTSPHRPGLEKIFGPFLFKLADMTLQTFKPEIMDDLKTENELATAYEKLLASASIMFAGAERNLTGLMPFMESPDREVRKNAAAASSGFMAGNRKELDRIFDELVKTRHAMARKLGFGSFTELAYLRLARSDYGPRQVKAFRDQVHALIVPQAVALRERQRKRLGLDKLFHYDIPFKFKTGNPQPQGDPDWIIANGRRMYRELSPETGSFIDLMIDHGLMDLVNKPGKAPGGYCSSLPTYKAPFIFANFNGTSDDVYVLTHEAGHAFQRYQSREIELPEYACPTADAAEIHSMSMEFITWPWMDLFFREAADKYRYMHLTNALTFLPYGVLVDEFQHAIYAEPEMSPEERHRVWRTLEKKYLPDKDYAGNEYLENGGFWQRQIHIYTYPFYYIDYALAQTCAFQFWKKFRTDRPQAWRAYTTLCRAGGSASFLELVRIAGLESPFNDGCLARVTGVIRDWLDSIDDAKF